MDVLAFVIVAAITSQESSIHWASRRYAEAVPVFQSDAAPQSALVDALDAYLALDRKGVSRVQIAPRIAELCARIGNRKAADVWLDRWPDCSAKQAFIREYAEKRHWIELFQRQATAGMTVLNVTKSHAPDGDRWCAIAGQVTTDTKPHWTSISKPTLLQIVRDQLIPTPLTESRFTDADFISELTLEARDLNGDGKQEVLVEAVGYGASWSPSRIHVFGPTPKGLQFIASYGGDEPIAVVRHKTGWAINPVAAVGKQMAHATMPRWPDFHTIVNGKMRLVNQDFPSQYKPLHKQMVQLLKQYPDDAEILHFDARALWYLGERTAAKRKFGWAWHALKQEMAKPDFYEYVDAKDRPQFDASMKKVADRYERYAKFGLKEVD